MLSLGEPTKKCDWAYYFVFVATELIFIYLDKKLDLRQ